MVKSRRKLRPMKVKGKVYDPMPRNPECAPRSRVTHNSRAARVISYVPSVENNLRKLRVFKSGKRRITF